VYGDGKSATPPPPGTWTLEAGARALASGKRVIMRQSVYELLNPIVIRLTTGSAGSLNAMFIQTRCHDAFCEANDRFSLFII